MLSEKSADLARISIAAGRAEGFLEAPGRADGGDADRGRPGGPEPGVGIRPGAGPEGGAGPSAAVVGLAVCVCHTYRACFTGALVVVAMVVEVLVKDNLAGREHLASIAAVLVVCAVREWRGRRREGRGQGLRPGGSGIRSGAPPMRS